MNRLFLTGDTHGELNRISSKNFKESKILDETDVIIILGDFGLLWWYPENKHYKQTLYNIEWLKTKKFNICFIDGNHENFYLLNKLPVIQKFGSEVGYISDNIFHLKRGNVYNINDYKILTIGGALSIDRNNRQLNVSYWNEELLSNTEIEKILNLIEYDNIFDLILTHTAPLSIIKQMFEYPLTEKVNDSTTKFLDHIKNNIKFKKWYFGHFHENCVFENYTCLYKNIIEINREHNETYFK